MQEPQTQHPGGRARCLADFMGAWRIDRVIRHSDGTEMTLTGQTVWHDTNTGAVQDEQGLLRLPTGAEYASTRRYLWGRDLSVYFDDGRFFHKVPASGGEARHWCDPDSYVVRYVFDSDTHWRSLWTVQGPRKSYRMETRYDRAA